MASTLAAQVPLADIDAEISVLEHSFPALRVQEPRDSHKYPVLTLLNEITSEIFIHFLPAHPDYPPLLGLDSPSLLTQICRGWREIAEGTPQLWSAILFNYSPPFAQKLHLCQIWLARSHSYLLDFRFPDLRGLGVGQVLDVIIPHRACWESLDLDLAPSDIHAIEGPMPILHHLGLTMNSPLNDVVPFPQHLCCVPSHFASYHL
ncbi:hypothetical protein K438DRAFT_440027 [Mycena galopus ATCC 62051]|nr:hypothetical protein K438DRAFT_440027 [Mycena galopus ATCC 62051]